MSTLLLILFTSFFLGEKPSTNPSRTIAIIENGEPVLLIPKETLLNDLNNIGKYEYDQVELIIGQENNINYHFLKLSSSQHNSYLTRWLVLDNDSLKIEDIPNDDWKHLNLFLECYGDEDYFPRLIIDANEVPHLACQSELKCVSPEFAKRHPCTHSKILVLN